MAIIHQRITIVNIRRPTDHHINHELQWLGTSLGLFNQRDKDQSCFRLFIELLKSTSKDQALSSDELAFRLNLSRGTVVHHLNKLLESGIVVANRNRYYLRVSTLTQLIDEIEKDCKRACDELRSVATSVDKKLGLDGKEHSDVLM